MPTQSHHQRFEVPAPGGLLAAIFRDPLSIPRIHPLITAVTVTGRRDEEGVEIIAFEVQETVPLGPFRIPSRYPAQLRCFAEDRFELLGRTEPGVTIRSVFSLHPRGNITLVDEDLEVTAPWWLLSFVTATVWRAHAEQAQALTALFTGLRRGGG